MFKENFTDIDLKFGNPLHEIFDGVTLQEFHTVFSGQKESTTQPSEKKIARDVYVGIPPNLHWFVCFVDGGRLTENSFTWRMRLMDRRKPQKEREQVSLNIQSDDKEWQFIEIEKNLNFETVEFLVKFVHLNRSLLLKISNDYEEHDRQLYHFMYDLISLVKSLEKFPTERSNMIMIKNGLQLFHNRIHAEIFSAYVKKGNKVEIEPIILNSNRKPDLKIDDVIVDVKTILISANHNNKQKTMILLLKN